MGRSGLLLAERVGRFVLRHVDVPWHHGMQRGATHHANTKKQERCEVWARGLVGMFWRVTLDELNTPLGT